MTRYISKSTFFSTLATSLIYMTIFIYASCFFYEAGHYLTASLFGYETKIIYTWYGLASCLCVNQAMPLIFGKAICFVGIVAGLLPGIFAFKHIKSV